jgi:hypothetical protein
MYYMYRQYFPLIALTAYTKAIVEQSGKALATTERAIG